MLRDQWTTQILRDQQDLLGWDTEELPVTIRKL